MKNKNQEVAITSIDVNPQEFKLEIAKATSIMSAFNEKATERDILLANSVVVLSKEITPELSKEARELRLKLVPIRTGIDKIHKVEKDFYLQAGKFVDAIKNKLQQPIVQREEQLKHIEEHFDRIEKERLEALQIERADLLRPYSDKVDELDLVSMDQEVFEAFLSARKLTFEALQNRIAEEEKQREIEAQKQKLKLDRQIVLSAYRNHIANYSELVLEDLTEKEFKAISTKAVKDFEADQKEKEKIAKENEKLKKELEKKAEAERKAKEKVEAEARAAEEKALKEITLAPKKQLQNWVNAFQAPETGIQHSTKDEILKKFEGFKAWALGEVSKVK
jgi:hypothetical protein